MGSTELAQERDLMRAKYHTVNALTGQPFLFHSVLFSILRRQVPASYIFELFCDEECVEDPDDQHTRNRDRLPALRDEAADVKSLIQDAIHSSGVTLPSEVEETTAAICAGNEDATLALLVPLLTNLRHLRPPMIAPRLEEAVSRIAVATNREPSTSTSSPLSKLVLISTNAGNGNEYGMSLESLASYAALPSVRRVVVRHGRSYSDDEYKGWPATLPLSRATEVYFSESTILPAVVRKFGDGFAGPCVMRQWWIGHGSQMPHRPSGVVRDAEWDYFRVEDGELKEDVGEMDKYKSWKAGTRKETMELRYEDVHDESESYSEVPLSNALYETEMNNLLEDSLYDWNNLS